MESGWFVGSGATATLMNISSVHPTAWCEVVQSTPSRESAVGHCPLERDGVGSMETDTSHTRKTAEDPQRSGTNLDGTSSASPFQSAR